MTQKKTKLSIIMIVKDEEKFLRKCLESVHDKKNLYEIVLVDTGSKDKTKEIAMSFPKVKYHYKEFTPWSFKDARNYSISKAKGNWLMYMDADEIFQGEFPDNLPDSIYNFKIQNITDSGEYVNSYCARMIPNIKGIKFINDMHEILASPNRELPINLYNHGTIIHYGYTQQVRAEKGKLERNLTMLTKAWEENKSSQTAYYLGQETFITGDHERCIELAKAGISTLDPTNALDMTFEPILYHLLVSAMIEAKRPHSDIEEFESKYAFKRPNPEIGTVLCSYYLNRHDPVKAAFYSMQAIKLNNSQELPVKYNENTVKFVSYIMMGEYYLKTVGDKLAALYWFELAHAGGCNDPGILNNIYQLLPKYKDIAKLDYYLQKLYSVTKDPNFLKELVNVYLNGNSPDLEKKAITIMNQVGNPDEIEHFKKMLASNGKDSLISEVYTPTQVSLPLKNGVPNSFTVIIPTMLLADHEFLKWNLQQLEDSPVVKEVIVIDNSADSKNFASLGFDEFQKVTVHVQSENIGFNASVNLGIAECTTQYYLILNDDCLIRSQIMDAASNLFENQQDAGVMVVDTIPGQPIEEYSTRYIDVQEDSFIEYDARKGSQYGWCIFGKKEQFKPIVPELHTFFGDNLLHSYAFFNRQKTYILRSNYVSHEVSKTVETLYGNLQDKDSEYNKKLLSEQEVFLKIVNGGRN